MILVETPGGKTFRKTRVSVNGGFQAMARVVWGGRIPLPYLNLKLTSFSLSVVS